jgi:hypothetical protein
MVLVMAAQIGIAKNGAVLIGQALYRSLRRGGDSRCSVCRRAADDVRADITIPLAVIARAGEVDE